MACVRTHPKGCDPPVNDEFCPDSCVSRGQWRRSWLGRSYTTVAVTCSSTTTARSSKPTSTSSPPPASGGCNPPVNDKLCPDPCHSRSDGCVLGAAFGYNRAGGGDLFVDDDGSIFEADIDRLATASVTRGCNPPTNDEYCPKTTSLEVVAAFLHRASSADVIPALCDIQSAIPHSSVSALVEL